MTLAGWGLRAIARVQESARRAEEYQRRLELAAELHDFVAHDLSEVVAHAQAARYLGDLDEALERIERAGVRSLESLEATVRALHTDSAARTLGALPELVERFNSAGGAQVTLTGETQAQLPVAVSALVYRTATEALTNLRKHSPGATTAALTIHSTTGHIHLTLTNSPAGAGEPGTGAGLRTLAERAEGLGGSLTAGPVDDGWRVELVLPV